MTTLAVALMVASWTMWLATIGAVVWIKFHNREQLWRITKLAFFASTFANVSVTLAAVWLMNRP